jgi:hypothetical protein
MSFKSGTKNVLITAVLFITMLSCGASFGERLTYGNLSIYYTPRNVGIVYAQRLGQYFESNELIQDKQHAIQLTSDSKGFILRMVLNDNYEQLPEDQERNLELLETNIREDVFEGLNFRIEVCNANFVPLLER